VPNRRHALLSLVVREAAGRGVPVDAAALDAAVAAGRRVMG
jgi:hypothetical protein